jgi:peroxiredoxin
VDISTQELFGNKKVVAFSLPGAFTPVCSTQYEFDNICNDITSIYARHLPRYNDLAHKFKELGIDEIYCISVNDAYVMNEWQKSEKAYNIKFIPGKDV